MVLCVVLVAAAVSRAAAQQIPEDPIPHARWLEVLRRCSRASALLPPHPSWQQGSLLHGGWRLVVGQPSLDRACSSASLGAGRLDKEERPRHPVPSFALPGLPVAPRVEPQVPRVPIVAGSQLDRPLRAAWRGLLGRGPCWALHLRLLGRSCGRPRGVLGFLEKG